MHSPLVTIGVTAFNAEDTISRAIRSALRQSYPAFEIVVVDDCSTDRTWEVVTREVAADPRVRAVRRPANGGVAAARNSIIAEARGDFIAFFDDDDESAPDRVATQVEDILRYERRAAPGAMVVSHAARRQIYPDGRERVERALGAEAGQPPLLGRAVVRRILVGEPVPGGFGSCATCSQVARTSAYRAVGGFDEAFRRNEDMDICIRLAVAGAHFVSVSRPLVDQKMQVTDEKRIDIEFHFTNAILAKHRAQFTSDAEQAFAMAWLRLKFAWLKSGGAGAVAPGLMLALRHPWRFARRLTYALPMHQSRSARRRLHRIEIEPLAQEGRA